MRRRKVLAWGAFCPVCRTVYRYPARTPIYCTGGHQTAKHAGSALDVVAVSR